MEVLYMKALDFAILLIDNMDFYINSNHSSLLWLIERGNICQSHHQTANLVFSAFRIPADIDNGTIAVYTMYKRGGATMQVQLKAWGNSQGIRFTKEFLAMAGIRPDETLTAEVQDGKIILSKAFQHRTLQQRAEAYGGQLNLSEEVDWGEPQGSEVW